MFDLKSYKKYFKGEMNLNGVLFDFNGTLLFDGKLQDESWHEFLNQKTGREISDEEFHEHMNAPTEIEALSYFVGKELSQAQAEALEEEKEIIYRAKCVALGEDFQLAPGLPDFLDALKKNNIPFNLATASVVSNVKFFFDKLDLGKWFKFDYVIHKDGKILSKPAPDMYLKAAEVIGLQVPDCVIFEDSRMGMKAAKTAHAKKIIGVMSSHDEETLKSYGASEVIADYTDVDRILKFILEDNN